MEADLAYFQRRALEERKAAAGTNSLAALRVHEELARRYDDLANAIGNQEQRLRRQLVQSLPISFTPELTVGVTHRE